MTVSEVIRTKRAVRQFTDELLTEEVIRSILNAGRRAQSSKNTQPWHFIAIRNRATLRHLAECGAYARHLAGAPFAVAPVASTADSFDLGRSLYAISRMGPGHRFMHRLDMGAREGQGDSGYSPRPSL
jgi:nitroreductase